jgi:3-hydroxyisobutyrate dehydrogenase-like beta-hydroxyacid dehydrogenase
MKPVIAIIGAGAMGSAVGKRLVEHGLEVMTPLEGRSDASRKRARDAGITPAGNEQLAASDMVLSIIPPGDALPVAKKLAPVLARSNKRPIYIDCNAVNAVTAERIGGVVTGAGVPFVDAGIIGGPPAAGYKGPAFYASGTDASRFAALNDYGLNVRVIDGPVGAASAMKMSYAGITKGFTALGSVMMLAATRAGTAEALHRELAQSQPELLAWLTRAVPRMYSKAYRWIAEMEEIAGFAEEDPAGHQIFEGAAELYRRLAADFEGANTETAALTKFLKG